MFGIWRDLSMHWVQHQSLGTLTNVIVKKCSCLFAVCLCVEYFASHHAHYAIDETSEYNTLLKPNRFIVELLINIRF